jgi:sulfane dehydrogenase subunit SoxC
MTKNGLYGANFTPLQHSRGIITPAGLHYEVRRAGVPVIDPARHRFIVHGLVRSPKVFTMEDLLRFPSVTRIYFLECTDNSFSEWKQPTAPDVQETHGLTSNSEWTGVPLATILREVGVRKDAAWLLAEGSDASGLMRSIPIEKAWEDALLVYAQNGEALRPEQGFPLRLLLPGFEGNMNIKWLSRLEVGDQPWYTRAETTAYTDLLRSGKARIFSFVMEAKSVITFPSGGMRLPAPGFYEITGLAWSGRGKVQGVEVSTDGGGTWATAHLQEPVLSKSHTRFRFPWHWDGRSAVLQSRVTDETGYVQPTLAQLVRVRGTESVNHNNAIQSWRVDANGSVTNVHHA